MVVSASLPLRATGAPGTPSTVNVTVPPGVPAPGAVTDTVARNVASDPKVDGEPRRARAVDVPALFTSWSPVREPLEATKTASPS